MKIFQKCLVKQLLLSAVLSISFVRVSCGMIPNLAMPIDTNSFNSSNRTAVLEETRLPHEMLAEYNTYTIQGAEAACQQIAGYFLQKQNTIQTKIDALAIDKLDAAYREALSSVRAIAEVDESFNLLGDVPADGSSFLAQVQEGQRKQNLLEIAQLQKESFEREISEVREYFEFFGGATPPLAFLLELKNLTVTREMQLPEIDIAHSHYNHQHHNYGYYEIDDYRLRFFQDAPVLVFLAKIKKKVLFFDVAKARKIFPRIVNHPDLSDTISRVEEQRDLVNKWFQDFEHVREGALVALQQARIQQTILSEKYEQRVLLTLNPLEVAAHRNKMRVASEKVNEKEGIMNVLKTFKGFVDDIIQYLEKNGRLS